MAGECLLKLFSAGGIWFLEIGLLANQVVDRLRVEPTQCARGFGFENVFASFWFWKRFEIESKTDFNCKRLQSVAKHGLMEVLNTF